MNSWQKWLEDRCAASTMQAQEILLADAAPWGVQNVEGGGEEARPSHVGRADGKFFGVIAILISMALREVKRWSQVILKEATKPGEEGTVVLVSDGHGNYLVQAKADAGNNAPGCVFLGPTLQASRANLTQTHGGTRPPRAELLDGKEIVWIPQPADGARFWHKLDFLGTVTADPAAITLSENERWFSEVELREAHRAGEVNSYLALAWLVASKQ